MTHFGGSAQNTGLQKGYTIPLWKRCLDITFIAIMLPLILPLSLAAAAMIKLSSEGPLLFKQERIGLRGEPFVLIKFRTMKPGSDHTVHELHISALIASDKPMTKLDAHDDLRLINFGRQLRATGLDELPQLLNVFRGEMSLVGPRPCLRSEYEKYLASHMGRFDTLPGLTGLWQVSGKNRTSFEEMLELDERYVRARSLWLDLTILLRTIPTIMGELKAVIVQEDSAR